MTSTPGPTNPVLRVGLAGTGHWARVTHAPALASADGITLAAVWGRDPRAAADLAAAHGATAVSSFAGLLPLVDAVAFSLPPDVQAGLAIEAARAGRHLLLEKPVALSAAAAADVAAAAEAAGVASVVFFTARFSPHVRAWLAAAHAASPFNTPWRQAKGGLWDLGPHVVSLLWAALGPVTAVTADAGGSGTAHLVL